MAFHINVSYHDGVIDTDETKINELLTRGVENVIPRELAIKKLQSGERLRIYHGIDPTGSKLHIGHTVTLRKLRQFSDLGHEIILVVGSFTAMIGDPTGRDAARSVLTKEQIEENFKDYVAQVSKVIDLTKFEVRYNHEWLDKINFEKIVDLASRFTVQQMLQRDMFEKRISEGKPISVHEFMYPLMVGYDSVVLDVDCELGGSDQEFNMLAGRHLQSVYGKREKFVLTTKLIEGTDGRKMSKSFNNCIYITDEPNDMFGKTMSTKDELVALYFDVCTDVPKEEQAQILAGHPKDAKMALAHELVRMYHGTEAADAAQENFEKTFSKGEVPEDVTEIKYTGLLKHTLVRSGIVSSNSEFVRLVMQEAIVDMTTGNKIRSGDAPAAIDHVFRIGKHRFVKIVR